MPQLVKMQRVGPFQSGGFGQLIKIERTHCSLQLHRGSIDSTQLQLSSLKRKLLCGHSFDCVSRFAMF